MFVSAKEVKERFQICGQTLYNWRKAGKIKFKRLNDRKFLYDVDSILGECPKNSKKNVIYARVSNSKQVVCKRFSLAFRIKFS